MYTYMQVSSVFHRVLVLPTVFYLVFVANGIFVFVANGIFVFCGQRNFCFSRQRKFGLRRQRKLTAIIWGISAGKGHRQKPTFLQEKIPKENSVKKTKFPGPFSEEVKKIRNFPLETEIPFFKLTWYLMSPSSPTTAAARSPSPSRIV